jgi:hypothetical protein
MTVFNFIAIAAYLVAAIISLQVTDTDMFNNLKIFTQAQQDWVQSSWIDFEWV